jgi:putative flavoprotein involved in K+ transport
MDRAHEAVIIGGGQSGLAAAHHLARRGIDAVVLEASDRVPIPRPFQERL